MKKPAVFRSSIFGVFWESSGEIFFLASNFITTWILARILTPGHFGLIAIAQLIVQVSSPLTSLGFNQALIQKKEESEETYTSVFWAALVLRSVTATGLAWIATPLAKFAGDVSSAPLIQAFVLLLPLNNLSLIPRAILKKHLQFESIVKRTLITHVFYAIFTIGGALLGLGAWSFFAGSAAQAISGAFLFFTSVDWRPRLFFRWSEIQKIAKFGVLHVSGDFFIRTFSNLDFFLVSRWIGTSALGIYTLAFQFAVSPMRRISYVFKNVSFPTFSSIQTDNARVVRGYLLSIKLIYILLLPIAVSATLLGPIWFPIILGQQWDQLITPFQILVWGGFFIGFDYSESILLANGKAGVRSVLLILRVGILLISSFWFGIQMGITGIAICVTLAIGVSNLVMVQIISREIRVSPLAILKELLAGAPVALGIAVIFGFIYSLFAARIPAAFLITTLVLLGLLLYALFIAWGNRDLVRKTIDAINSRSDSKNKQAVIPNQIEEATNL
jgi:PST family polysaccharide transporter